MKIFQALMPFLVGALHFVSSTPIPTQKSNGNIYQYSDYKQVQLQAASKENSVDHSDYTIEALDGSLKSENGILYSDTSFPLIIVPLQEAPKPIIAPIQPTSHDNIIPTQSSPTQGQSSSNNAGTLPTNKIPDNSSPPLNGGSGNTPPKNTTGNGTSPPSKGGSGNASPPTNGGSGHSPPTNGGSGHSPPTNGGSGNSPPTNGGSGNSPPTNGGTGNSPPSNGGSGNSPPSNGGSGNSPPSNSGQNGCDPATFQSLINNLRSGLGKGTLCYDSRLMQSTMAHSLDMSAHNFMGHQSSDGTDPFTRIKSFGFGGAAGECAAEGTPDANSAFTIWKDDPPHYDIMVGDYNVMGIACVNGFATLDVGIDDKPNCMSNPNAGTGTGNGQGGSGNNLSPPSHGNSSQGNPSQDPPQDQSQQSPVQSN